MDSFICSNYYNRFLLYSSVQQKEINLHKERLDVNEPGDYIDAFLIEMRKHSPENSWFHETHLLHCLGDMFIAGTETTTNTILWALLALIHHPETQEKLYQELFDNIGEQVLPSTDHRDKLPLFRAFTQEVYRFKTIVPLALQHRANKDVEIGGYVIPKGTKVFPNLHAVHHDPNIWKNRASSTFIVTSTKTGNLFLRREWLRSVWELGLVLGKSWRSQKSSSSLLTSSKGLKSSLILRAKSFLSSKMESTVFYMFHTGSKLL
ncbi:cytochrome P450 2U1-like [Ciona intestinalis]